AKSDPLPTLNYSSYSLFYFPIELMGIKKGPDMIVVDCECGKRLKTKDQHAGKRTQCPSCGRMVTFPQPGSAIEPAPEDFEIAAPPDLSPEPEPEPAPEAQSPDWLEEIGVGPKAGATASRPEPPSPTGPRPAPPAVPEPWYYGFLAGYAIVCIIL